jgi:hypothetical protein
VSASRSPRLRRARRMHACGSHGVLRLACASLFEKQIRVRPERT